MKKKKFLAIVASAGLCLQLPACLNVDNAALLGLGSGLACEVLTSGLPFSSHLDYCSVVDIDLGAGL